MYRKRERERVKIYLELFETILDQFLDVIFRFLLAMIKICMYRKI